MWPERERERTEKTVWYVLVPAGDRWEHVTTCWCVIVMSVSPHSGLSALSVFLTSGSGATEGTLCLWTMRIRWRPVIPSPVRRASEPSLTNRPSSHSRQCDDIFLRLRCIIQCLSGSRWQDERGGAVFPRNERTDLSPSPESETLHLHSAWWAFKSLKWVFGSVAPQEAAHLSPKWLFV